MAITRTITRKNGQSYSFLLNEEDLPILQKYAPYIVNNNGHPYVYVRETFENGRFRNRPLHVIIAGAQNGEVVHHRDCNPLNNTRDNLVIVSKGQNSMAKKKGRGKSRFKGVFLSRGRWVCQLSHDYKRYSLGSYDTEENAAIAYDLFVKENRPQELQILNFPDRDYGGMSLVSWRKDKARDQQSFFADRIKKIEEKTQRIIEVARNIAAAEDDVVPSIISVSDMARAVGLSRASFHSHLQRGTFPSPKHNNLGRPYYDKELQEQCLRIRKTGLGANGEPTIFYNKNFKQISQLHLL